MSVAEPRMPVKMRYFPSGDHPCRYDGACAVTGDWMEIVFVPRLGKKDWNSIIPVIGAPIDLLSNIFKGALMPVVMKGSFEHPEISVEPFHFLKPSVKQLIEEKSPR